jgi:alkylation response protein AidB-like acyl-CoA dehydrogenase
MIGVGRHIPLRDLGEQLGLSHGAVRVRLSRLRERFIRLAIQYVGALAPAEKSEMQRFFRRAKIRLDPSAAGSGESRREAGPKTNPLQEQS